MPHKSNRLEYLLFAAYLVLFAWLVTRVRFFRETGLTPAQLVIIFLLKVMAGIFYGWIGVYYWQLAQMVDTWAYHYESLKEYELLLKDPVQFATSLFHNTYENGYTNFLTSENSWWNDLKANFVIKILAIFNLFSFGNYFTNIIFYSFISLFGPVAMYRVMKDVFQRQKLAVLLATFVVPSFIYWTSGIHKDGLIFLGFALITYHIYFGLKQGFAWYRYFFILLGFTLVLVMRNFLILPLLPSLLAWVLAHKLKFRPALVFASVFVVSLILFFGGRKLHHNLDFPASVAIKQQEFMKLGGNSAVHVDTLRPTVAGFVHNAPQAFLISTIRPYPSDVRHLLSLAAAAEINFLLLLFVVFLFYRLKPIRLTPFLCFCLFFSFAVLMMVGYSVNILGAIVRYRSIIFPYLIVPMAALTDWKRIFGAASQYIDIK